jgi:poly(3-hydroxybutyrate) depolymerase
MRCGTAGTLVPFIGRGGEANGQEEVVSSDSVELQWRSVTGCETEPWRRGSGRR